MERKLPQKIEIESLPVALSHLHRDMSRMFLQHVGMSFSRFLVLDELRHAGESSQSELQRRLGMEGALITRFVKEMESARLVTRRVDPEDNRFSLVALAPEGRSVLEKMRTLRQSSEAQLLDGVSDNERALMLKVIKRIQENISRWQ